MRLKLHTFLLLSITVSTASASICPAVLVRAYQTVRLSSLDYDGTQIFKDPRDTETISSLALRAVREGDLVLDLGSGSGIAVDALMKIGKARRVVGLDVSEKSVLHAQARYGSERVSFFVSDYRALGAQELVTQILKGSPPDLIISNPPYVPSLGHTEGLLRTIDGGPDGLRFVRHIIDTAAVLNARLAFIMGSYSNPIEAFRLLQQKGYRVKELTLSVLPFGDFSKKNESQILTLEREHKAYLLRKPYRDRLAYVAIGVIAERCGDCGPELSLPELDSLFNRLTLAETSELESLPHSFPVPVRVLVLPDGPPQ